MSEVRQLHLRGALGVPRTEEIDGHKYLIVPVVALMDGVIHAVNAATPERVTSATLKKAAATFNGRPLVLGHPTKNGRQCSANEPAIKSTHHFGMIFNSRMAGDKLLMDAYVDPIRAEKLGGTEFVQSLRDGRQCEVSVGAFVTTDEVSGTHNGKSYKATWLETIGDHLAFLPGGRGACSIEMGCGAHRAAMHLVTAEGLEMEEPTWSERLSSFVGDLKALVGKRNSAADLSLIQEMHDRSTALGADCSGVRQLASKHCETCDGTGQVKKDEKQQDCPSCEGSGYMKAAEFKAACSCVGDDMTKAERIAVLAKNEHNPTKSLKALEALDDAEIAALETFCKSAAELKAAADKAIADKKATDEKAAADLKAAEEAKKSEVEKLTAQITELKAASEKPLTEDDARLPQSIRALVANHKAAEAAEKTELVAKLKTSSTVLTEEQLNAKSLDELKILAAFAKVDAAPAAPADYSGRGIPMPRAASGGDFTPPDPYEAGIKALQGSKTVN